MNATGNAKSTLRVLLYGLSASGNSTRVRAVEEQHHPMDCRTFIF